MPWQPGEAIVRREVWRGKPWTGMTVRVVRDDADLLVTYTPEGSPFAFPDGDWPGGRHPWHGRTGWEGLGVLAIHRPGDPYAVFAFWEEPGRRLACWYVNLQEPFRRTPIGFDTLDHDLDIVIEPDGRWWLKDSELLDAHAAEGRWTSEDVAAIRGDADRLTAELAGGRWWDEAWADWMPPAGWKPAPLPEGWDVV
jgi:Protein of unknown function (DUF402)